MYGYYCYDYYFEQGAEFWSSQDAIAEPGSNAQRKGCLQGTDLCCKVCAPAGVVRSM